jgi:hypothetical protein
VPNLVAFYVPLLEHPHGTAVGPDMHFPLKVNWQIFRILLFYDYFILREDLVIKIERVLQRRILIEIAADRHKHTRLPGRHWTGCVENMQPGIFRKKD